MRCHVKEQLRWTTLRVVSKKGTKSWFRAHKAAIACNQVREGFEPIHDDRTQTSNRVVILEVQLVFAGYDAERRTTNVRVVTTVRRSSNVP